MWNYDKRLQYPVKIARPNPALAKVIVSQLGGPHGELGAATRYLSQRFTAPNNEVIATLTDIGLLVSELLPLYIGAAVFAIVNRHFSGKIFKYKSIVLSSTITILSKICL